MALPILGTTLNLCLEFERSTTPISIKINTRDGGGTKAFGFESEKVHVGTPTDDSHSLSVEAIREMSSKEKVAFLCKTLGFPAGLLEEIPPGWKLLVLSLRFWTDNSKVSMMVLKTLAMSFVMQCVLEKATIFGNLQNHIQKVGNQRCVISVEPY